jgi:uncharacterized membrane protein
MTASQGTDQVERYLRELSAALSAMPDAERADVVAGIREHIDASLPNQPTDADIERVLGGLGDPLAIAAEAGGGPQASVEPNIPMLRRSWVPAATALSLMLGVLFSWLVVPILFWLAGVVLLWASPLWRTAEKILGTVVFVVAPPVVLGTGLMSVSAPSGRCDGVSVDSVTVECVADITRDSLPQVLLPYVLYFVVLIGTGVFLWRRGAARALVSAEAAGGSPQTAPR